jgi:hypothetical protein
MEKNLNLLYEIAKKLAINTEGFGESFAGKCGNISLGSLDDARSIFGKDVQLVIGWVEIKGVKQFYFDDNQMARWIKGEKPEKYNLHCWLSLNGKPIDLTLAETIYSIEKKGEKLNLIPEGITYIGPKQAEEHDINFYEKRSGDKVLEEIGMM